MADFQNENSSFFMFCFGDFSSKLSIPTAFANKYTKFLRQVSLELKTAGSGQSWDVKIKKTDNKWYIADGWSQFATDNQLEEINLLIFRIAGESALDVSIFRNDSCLEEPSTSDDQENEVKTWRFVKELKENSISNRRMSIPKSFVWGTGISTKCNVELENVEGNKWTVSVTDRNRDFYSFTRGWTQFLRENKFKDGTILLFEFVPNSDNVVKVLALENEVGIEKLSSSKKLGGIIRS